MRRERRARAFEAVDRATELPLLALALAMVPLLVAPFVLDLSDRAETVALGLDWIIWALFAVELMVKTYLAPSRRSYLTSHWFDVVIVVVPFLRPLRVARSARALRLLRGARLLSVLARLGGTTRAILTTHGLQYVLLLVLGAALLVALLERNADGSISDVGSALWWAAAKVTTVGYGDVAPVTAAGRGVGVFLMFVGIGVFGVVTANVAAFFVQGDPEAVTNERLLAELRTLRQRIESLDREP